MNCIASIFHSNILILYLNCWFLIGFIWANYLWIYWYKRYKPALNKRELNRVVRESLGPWFVCQGCCLCNRCQLMGVNDDFSKMRMLIRQDSKTNNSVSYNPNDDKSAKPIKRQISEFNSKWILVIVFFNYYIWFQSQFRYNLYSWVNLGIESY